MGLLKDVSFAAGVVKDDTERAVSGRRGGIRWTDSDRIRFVNKLPQKIGGWEKYVSNTFDGKCRGLMAWQDNNSAVRIGVGTHKKLYALEGQSFTNITPIRATSALTDPFSVTSGSATVTVTDTAHAALVGDFVEISGASAVGGITVDGNYDVKTVVDADTYRIEHSSAASSTASGGGSVTIEYEIAVGGADAGQGYGYGVGGYGQGTYGTARTEYIVIPPRTWSVDQWGQFMVACPRNGNIYEWQLNSNTRAVIISNAPTSNIGMFVTEEKHMVALGAGGNKMKVEWCDQDDNTVWTPADTNTAGGRNLTGGSEILTGIRTRGTNLIFTDAAVWSMNFIAGDDVFGFNQVAAGASGIVSPSAAVEVDGIVFWMGLNDFYFYDGVVRRMPNSKDVRRFVFDNLTTIQKDKVYCGLNTAFSEIWWHYPTGTENDRYVKFNYDDRAWDVGSIARTAMLDRDIIGNPLMAGTDDYIYKHESTVNADGSAMNEFIKSSPFELGDGNNLVEIMSLLPDFKDLVGTITLTLYTRFYPHDTENTETGGSVTSSTTTVDTRASGRQVAVKISSSATGTSWRFGTLRMDLIEGGDR